MEKIKELKEQAYCIATQTYHDGYSEHYRWSIDIRLDAMRTYAQLVLAENNNTKLMDTNANI
jgi:hypothetical protein